MKKLFVSVFLCIAVPSVILAGSLDDIVKNIDLEAKADFSSVRADMAAEFGVSESKIDIYLKAGISVGNLYLCMKVGKIQNTDTERVIEIYKKHKDKGWGVISKELGIKPGSKEFHALKSGGLSESAGTKKNNTGKKNTKKQK